MRIIILLLELACILGIAIIVWYWAYTKLKKRILSPRVANIKVNWAKTIYDSSASLFNPDFKDKWHIRELNPYPFITSIEQAQEVSYTLGYSETIWELLKDLHKVNKSHDYAESALLTTQIAYQLTLIPNNPYISKSYYSLYQQLTSVQVDNWKKERILNSTGNTILGLNTLLANLKSNATDFASYKNNDDFVGFVKEVNLHVNHTIDWIVANLGQIIKANKSDLLVSDNLEQVVDNLGYLSTFLNQVWTPNLIARAQGDSYIQKECYYAWVKMWIKSYLSININQLLIIGNSSESFYDYLEQFEENYLAFALQDAELSLDKFAHSYLMNLNIKDFALTVI